MWTKKHFKAAANIVSGERIPGFAKLSLNENVRTEIAYAFVAFFKTEVSNFNEKKFLEACKIQGI